MIVLVKHMGAKIIGKCWDITIEKIEGSEVEKNEELGRTEEIKWRKSLKALIEKLQEMQVLLKEKHEGLKGNSL